MHLGCVSIGRLHERKQPAPDHLKELHHIVEWAQKACTGSPRYHRVSWNGRAAAVRARRAVAHLAAKLPEQTHTLREPSINAVSQTEPSQALGDLSGCTGKRAP